MAFTDFGLDKGLAYRYDFNAKYSRDRQDRADKIAEQRYADEKKYRDDQNAISDERYQQSIQWRDQQQTKQDAKDYSQLYSPAPYSKLFQEKVAAYMPQKLEEIGAIEHTPNWTADPELVKKYNQLQFDVRNMPGFAQLKSSEEDYAQMMKDVQSGKIDSTEAERQKLEWDNYNAQTGKYSSGEVGYSYIPKKKFEMLTAIDNFIPNKDIIKQTIGQDAKGRYYTDNTIPNELLGSITEEFYNKNKEEIKNTFDAFDDKTKALYGSGENAYKNYVKNNIKSALKLERQYLTTNLPRNNNKQEFFKPTFLGQNTSGENAYVSDLIPIADGQVKTSALYFYEPDQNGNFVPTNTPIAIPANAKLNAVGGGKNIKNWIRTPDGQLMGEVEVYMNQSDFNAMSMELGINDNTALMKNGGVQEKEMQKTIKDPMGQTGDEKIMEKMYTFKTWVPFDVRGVKKFNAHSNEHDPYNYNATTEASGYTLGSDEDVPPPPRSQ